MLKPVPPNSKLLKSPHAVNEAAFNAALAEAISEHEEMFDGLGPAEQRLVIKWLEETILTGKTNNGVLASLEDIDLIRTPVSIEQYLTDHDYMGGVFTDRATESSIDVLARPWIDDLIHVFEPGNNVFEWLMTGSIGIGKCQLTKDTVLTSTGWREIGTLQVGDKVIGRDGRETSVEGVYPQGVVQFYRVSFTDGAYLDVGEDHLWEVARQHRTTKARTWKTEVVDTKTLADRKLKDGENWTHRIPLVEPVHYTQPETPLPIPAYTLGALLGDGCFTKGTPMLAGVTDLEVGERAQRELPDIDIHRDKEDKSWVFSQGRMNSVRDSNSVTKKLRELQLWDRLSAHKFIPARYLRASTDDRLELLRGLMDTDGHITDGNCAVFSTSSPTLARDVRELVLSLGGVCSDTSFNRDGSMEYQVKTNMGSVCPFWLIRKASKWKPRTNQQPRRAIVSVEKIDRADGVCIKVDAPDQLYVARDFIVTHNTTIAAIALTYTVYRLSCLRNPARYYGLPSNSMFVCQVYSITKRQVSDAGYSMVRQFIDSSPYFREEFPRNRKIETVMDFTPTTHVPLKISGGCVAAGTLIETPDGPVPIEQLAATQSRLYTVSKTGNVSVTGYAGVIGSGVKKCLVLKTDSGYNLTCSLDHKIWSPEKQDYVRAQDLNIEEEVLTLQPDQAGPRVLQAEREAAGSMQGVCEGDQHRALSRDKDLQGQGVTADRLPEAVQFVQEDQVAGSVRCEGQEEQVGREEVPEITVQALRKLGYQGLLPRQLGRMSVEEAETSYRSIRAGKGQRTKQEVLHGESRGDLGAVVVARVAYRYPETRKGVEEEKPRQSSEVSPAMAGAIPREGAGTCAEVGQVTQREEGSTCSQFATQSEEAVISGHAYFVGHRLLDGVLWGAVCLLRDNADVRDCDDGSRGPAQRRRTHNAGEYGAVLHDVQFTEEGFRPVRVCESAKREESRSEARGDGTNLALHRSRIVSIEEVGDRETFDVSDVDSTTHAVISNGIVSSNSQGFHGLGLNVFSFSMDEVNFMRQTKDSATGENVGQAYDVYNTLLKRVKSRFNRPGGTIPGIMLMMSSKNAHTSFIDNKVRQVTKRNNIDGLKGDLGGGVYLSDYALWEVKKSSMFGSGRFLVEKGDRTQRSRILMPDEMPRSGAKVVEVPEDFRRDFEEDIDKGLRDIAGESTYNVSPLIYDNKSVYDAIRKGIEHPFTRRETSLSEEDDKMLEDWFETNRIAKVHRSKWLPKINPGAPRYIHVDIGLTGDSAGIAMGHPSGKVKIKTRNRDGTTSTVTRPHITIDFMMRIRPPKTSEIALWKIRSFILFLRQMYKIQKVTYDGFQSADSCQMLRHEGIDADRVSLDKDDVPYMTLRSALSDRRLMYYEYQPFITEVLDLQHFLAKSNNSGGTRRKVDHPERSSDGGPGSKDVADAVCGVVYQCVNDAAAIAESMNGDVIDPTGFHKTQTPDPDKPTRTQRKPPIDFAKLRENLKRT